MQSMISPQTVAIFSGSFDPPTIAHATIIYACLNISEIDQIWVMPTGSRDDKNIVASPEDRLTMLRIMKEKEFSNSSRLLISDFELKLPQPTQTIRTVKALEKNFPNNHFWFIYGGDSYESLPTWEYGGYLRDNLPVFLVNRTGFILPPESNHIIHIKLDSSENLDSVSSTTVRRSIEKGHLDSPLITESTRTFIIEHKLYNSV